MEYGNRDLHTEPQKPLLSLGAAIEKKNREREEIESLTALFLRSGGSIVKIQPGERAWRDGKPG